jgi:hypothetical protein
MYSFNSPMPYVSVLYRYSLHIVYLLLGDAILERTFHSLTSGGQKWATSSQICVMQELNDFLRAEESNTCSELDRYVLSRYPVCLTQSHPSLSLCSAICDNLSVFLHIFDSWNLKSFNLKRVLLETSLLCPEQSQTKHFIDLDKSNLRTIIWSLCLDSLKGSLRNFDPSKVMTATDSPAGMFADELEEN